MMVVSRLCVRRAGLQLQLQQERGIWSCRICQSSKVNAAAVFNEKRVEYKKAVSLLRKQYALEFQKEKQSKALEEEEARQAQIRKRLERQRRKHLKAARSAQLELEKRRLRALEFEEELKVQQVKRDEEEQLRKKAQALLIAELEEEAPHWLTSEEEVERTFNSAETEQQLWTHPGGCVGAPRPTEDAEFWKYVSHTWDMSRTYQSPRDLMLEHIQDQLYWETNVDMDTYWTEDRLQQTKEVRDKAKLRAMVREEGRRSLLLQQRRLLQDRFRAASKDDIPKPMPVPKLQVLANKEAMEKEGVKILQADLNKFIDPKTGQLNQLSGSDAFFPKFYGRLPRKDTRTEKEKKRDAREEKLLAAAAAKDAVEFAAEESLQDGRKPLNYNELGKLKDQEDIDWERGINDDDDELLSLPSHQRLTQDDIDWLVSQLETKMETLTEIYKMERNNELQSKSIMEDDDLPPDANHLTAAAAPLLYQDGDQAEAEGDIDFDKWQHSYEMETIYDQNQSLLASLTPSQVQAINDLPTTSNQDENTLKAAFDKVPGLSTEQVQALVDLELSLQNNPSFQKHIDMDDHNKNNNKSD